MKLFFIFYAQVFPFWQVVILYIGFLQIIGQVYEMQISHFAVYVIFLMESSDSHS